MKLINFEKLQGSGNDFVMIDNRAGIISDSERIEFVRHVCPRGTAVGADGVIFVENDPELNFKWRFFNADGSEAEMCGNGSRCVAVFANAIGAAGKSMTFRTIAGPIEATLTPGGARVKLTDATLPKKIEKLSYNSKSADAYFLNTGVPHVIVPVPDLEKVDIRPDGAAIRYHEKFAPAGTNANFMAADGENRVALRTYERGVEDETLACGTGSVAASIVAAEVYGMSSPVTVRSRSGVLLNISFEIAADSVKNVYLEGPVVRVYRGEMEW
jgi:diaminopimelate epimerase